MNDNDLPRQDDSDTIDRAREIGFQFPSDALSLRNVAERGEVILDGAAQLVRIPTIERIVWDVPTHLVEPNPSQPREYFDPAKMEELRATLGEVGQKVPAVLVPIQLLTLLPPEQAHLSTVRLLIVDGERRFRLQKERGVPLLASVQYASTFAEVFFESLIINESKADHNPIERARAYQLLIEQAKKTGHTTRTVEYIAFRLGIHWATIQNHLRLLQLPEEIQALVARGEIPTSQALQLQATTRKFGELAPGLGQARAMLDGLHDRGDESSGATPGLLSKHGLRKARREALSQGATLDELTRAGIAANDIVSATNAVERALRRVLDLDPFVVRTALRQRTMQPPEDLVRRVLETRERLDRLLEVGKSAVRPEPLESVPGKLAFAAFIELNRFAFRTDLQYRVAHALAKLSDQKTEVMTAAELADFIGSDSNAVASVIARMPSTLANLGLEIDNAWPKGVRAEAEPGKRARSQFRRVPAYRLKWKSKEEIVVPKAATPASVPAPAPAPKPTSRPAPAQRPAPVAAPVAAPSPSPLVQAFISNHRLDSNESAFFLELLAAGAQGIEVADVDPRKTRLLRDLRRKISDAALVRVPERPNFWRLHEALLSRLSASSSAQRPAPVQRPAPPSPTPTPPPKVVAAPDQPTREDALLADATNPNNPIADSKKFPFPFVALAMTDVKRYRFLERKALKVHPTPDGPKERLQLLESLSAFGVHGRLGDKDTIVLYWNGKTGGRPHERMEVRILELSAPLISLES